MSDKRIWNAVIDAIKTERDAMYFYQRAALRMRDKQARKTFLRLANDEREHAESFLEIYQGDQIPDLAEHLQDQDHDSEWMLELEGLLDSGFDDIQALQLAMLKERHLERQLRKLAATIDDPMIRNVYQVNADSTRQHYGIIETEYKRLTGQD